jgi:RNA polymerase sigma factor (sigma-70 family)
MTRRGRRAGAALADIEAVYRLRLADFQRVAAAITGDREAASDVVQEAFARAVRSRRQFRHDGPLEAWLWRAVVNTARTIAARTPLEEPHWDIDGSPNGTPPEAGAADLRVALALLPERQRLALFLRYYADLDYRAIADVLGVTTGTVAATLHAAHAALRRRSEEVVG